MLLCPVPALALVGLILGIQPSSLLLDMASSRESMFFFYNSCLSYYSLLLGKRKMSLRETNAGLCGLCVWRGGVGLYLSPLSFSL